MHLINKDFGELSLDELYKILDLRARVFYLEQNINVEDTDFLDKKARHLFIKVNDEIVSYLRILKKGFIDQDNHIGRILTRNEYRNKGYAKYLISEALKYLNYDCVLSAQSHLIKYYETFGFKCEGNQYQEAGISHQKMRYNFTF